MTQGGDQVAEEDAEVIEEDQEQVIGTVPDPTAVERPRRNARRPGWLTTDMVIAHALPVIAVSYTHLTLPTIYSV